MTLFGQVFVLKTHGGQSFTLGMSEGDIERMDPDEERKSGEFPTSAPAQSGEFRSSQQDESPQWRPEMEELTLPGTPLTLLLARKRKAQAEEEQPPPSGFSIAANPAKRLAQVFRPRRAGSGR